MSVDQRLTVVKTGLVSRILLDNGHQLYWSLKYVDFKGILLQFFIQGVCLLKANDSWTKGLWCLKMYNFLDL